MMMGFSVLLLVLLVDTAQASAHVVISPEDLNTPLGHTLLLPCVVATNDDSSVHVTWRYNQQPISTTPHLQVHTLMTSQRSGLTLIKSVLEVCVTSEEVAGNYSCTAVTTGQETLDQETFHISVETPHVPVRILVAPADIDAATPNPPTLAVTCVATGMPHPHITWQRNGHLVTNQFIQEEVVIRNGLEVVVGTLLICPLRPEWGGEYTCQARNQHSLAEASFTVATTVAVVESTYNATENVTIGRSHTLSCDFLGYPSPTISWTFNDRLADGAAFAMHQETLINGPSGQIITRSYLNFTAHSILFTGRYVCMSTAPHTKEVQVNVQVPARIMVEPVSASHGLTSSVIVACVAYGVPPPTVTWRYGTSLSGGVHRTQHELIHGIPVITSSLELCPTRETAINGVYSCEVENGVTDSKIKSTPVHICFIGSFGVIVSPSDRDIVAGGSYYLPCVAFSKNGRVPTITWSARGNEIKRESSKLAIIFEEKRTQNGVQLLRSILELRCASFEDAVEYACGVTDGIESTEERFTLHFTSIPIIEEGHIVKRHGDHVSFECIVSGYPTPNVTWWKDGQCLKEDEGFDIQESHIDQPGRRLNSTLTLSGLTKQDEGYYTCRAENKLGLADMEQEYTLSLIPPETPGGVQSKAVEYASYSGSVLCVFPLLAVAVVHLASKHLRSLMETIPILNFCIATSLLYLFYIPSSSGPWSSGICALFSSLFHLSFLSAAFSCSNLVLLRTIRNYSKAKLVYAVAIILNWGLPVLCLVVSIAPDRIRNYTNDSVCVPLRWPLWLGLLLPFAASHAISWVILLFSPFIILKGLRRDNPAAPYLPVLGNALGVASILLLFDLAWVLQVLALSADESATKTVVLQSMFVASSACLGTISLLYFCFLQSHVRRVLFQCNRNSSEEIDSVGSTECQIANGKGITMPTMIIDQSSIGDESGVVNKQADL